MAAKYSYAFRPRKQIQRVLVVDACQRLQSIASPVDYEYIGFGGFEFIDFDLFHRRLGLQRLVSYEKDPDPERYEFNRPFACIEMESGPASQYLPFLDKETLRIVWLDYTSRLNADVLQDAAAAASRLRQGSVLLLSVNAVPAKLYGSRRAQLADDVGEDQVPNGVDDESLAKWGLADVQRRILLGAIDEALAARPERAVFEPLFYFRYADGAQMLTVGGIVVGPDVREAFEDARFEELDQVSRDSTAIDISVPALTAKEALYMNRQLPVLPGAALECPGIEEHDVEAYRQFYRWYPPIPAPI